MGEAMRLKNFNLMLMLVAGIIVGVVSIVFSYSLERLMFTLMIVLGAFYFLGTVIQMVVNNIYEATVREERKKELAQLEEEKKELVLDDSLKGMTEEQQEQ